MNPNLPPQTLYDFIVNDFESLWNCLASRKKRGVTGRGNFGFALLAMIFLEFAARLCSSDSSGRASKEFSNALHKIEPLYFVTLPGPCFSSSELALPSVSGAQERELLGALYDLIRNGEAHQYQQIIVELNDGNYFIISISGADYGWTLKKVNGSRPIHIHLVPGKDEGGNITSAVSPAVLFLDIKGAIKDSGLLNRGLSFPHLSRPNQRKRTRQGAIPGPFYKFDSPSVWKNLAPLRASRWVVIKADDTIVRV